jgi:hypothetical protein
VLKDRIRIREFFLDFDRLRKGTVGEAGFRSALGTLNIQLDEEEIADLISKYKLPTGLVNYSAFCKKVNGVFELETGAIEVIKSSESSAKFSDSEKNTLT